MNTLNSVRRGALLLLALIPWLSLRAQPIPDADCLQCHEDKDLVKTNAVGRAISLYVDQALVKASIHRTNSCFSCHGEIKSTHPDDNVIPQRVDCSRCHEVQSTSYGTSVHGKAHAAGVEGSALCVDCHGTHGIQPPTSPSSPLHRSRLLKTCGDCHPTAARELADSVHGKALSEGRREAPACTDCHAEHQIEKLRSTSAMKISQEVCSGCHASERINTKFKLPKDRVETFFESYHGLAAHGGSARAANCASCHGFHRILPSSDPRSTIHQDHLVETCGKCHPGATENFALAKVHVGPNSADDGFGGTVNRWVRQIYILIIVGTIGGMLVHNFFAWGHKALEAFRSRQRTVVRMSRMQRIQHMLLLATFFLLAFSGFALKYPDSVFGWVLGGNELVRLWVHRGAGVLLLVVGAAHLVYVAATIEGRQLLRDLLPAKQDWTDIKGAARYLAGKTKVRPHFGRFGYAEKMEYWAVLWGTIIMGATGLIIWLKIDVTQWLPRWAVDVATTVHFYEAILACLAIIVWHFYFVFIDPDVYPMNWAWWDGKVEEAWQAEHHSRVAGTERLSGTAPVQEGVTRTDSHTNG